MRALWRTVPVVAGILVFAAAASADEVRVMTSGGFTAAYLELVPLFEQATHHTIVSTFGASMERRRTRSRTVFAWRAGRRRDSCRGGARRMIKQGKVVAGSRVDLVRSSIGMAVRAGAPKPDITSVDALTRTLLQAKSIAYSDSASGVYLSTVLFSDSASPIK